MNNSIDNVPTKPAVLIYHKFADARTPRAAWFDNRVKATTTLHAKRQGFIAIDITDAQVDLVKAAVSEGEELSAGKVSLSPIKRDVLDRLLANLAGEPADAPDGSGKLPAGTMPTHVGLSDDIAVKDIPVDPLWAALTVNMVVLAPEYTDNGVREGWWEAIITAIHDDVFTLRFRDYPRQPAIHRKRDEVALMYPPPVRA